MFKLYIVITLLNGSVTGVIEGGRVYNDHSECIEYGLIQVRKLNENLNRDVIYSPVCMEGVEVI